MQTGEHRPWYRARWLRILLLFVLLTGGGFTALWWVQSSALSARLDELRAQGLPTSVEELDAFYALPPGVPDTTKAWMDAIAAMNAVRPLLADSELPIIGVSDSSVPLPGDAWDQFDQARQFLSDNEAILAATHAACVPGGCARFPVDFTRGIATTFESMQEIRGPARILALDAHVSAHSGDHLRARRDISDLLHASQALRVETTVVGQLLRLALFGVACELAAELLPHLDSDDADLAALQDLLRQADFAEGMRLGLCGERAICLHEIRKMSPRIIYNTNAIKLLDLFDSAIRRMPDGWPAVIASQEQITVELRKQFTGILSRMIYLPVLLIMPAQDRAVTAAARAAAKQRSLIAAIAAERYRRRHGSWPAALDDIPVELFAPSVQASPDRTDPFTGRPLQYATDKNSVMVYSVGPDLVDDGGAITDEVQVSASDTGVRLQAPLNP